MATLTRLHDFETDRDATPPVAISATKVDAEFDQILTETNAADVRLDAIEERLDSMIHGADLRNHRYYKLEEDYNRQLYKFAVTK